MNWSILSPIVWFLLPFCFASWQALANEMHQLFGFFWGRSVVFLLDGSFVVSTLFLYFSGGAVGIKSFF